MSQEQLDYQKAPAEQTESYDFFWKMTLFSTALIVGIMFFLFFAYVAGSMSFGLLSLAAGIIASIYFLVKI